MNYLNVELNKSSLFGKDELLRELEAGDCTVHRTIGILEERYGAAMYCQFGSIGNCIVAPIREGLLMLFCEYWEGIEVVLTHSAKLMDANDQKSIINKINERTSLLTYSIQGLAQDYGLAENTQLSEDTPGNPTYMGHSLDPDTLLGKDELLARLRAEDHGCTYKSLSEILTSHIDGYDELKWHYPISDGEHSGGFLVPVREGLLYIPYNEVYNADEYEVLLADKASLMDEESCEMFANELMSFSDGICKAMREAMEVFKNVRRPDSGDR